MGFRDSEKRRLEPLKEDLFTHAACEPGLYRGRRRPFCLHEHHSLENLHESIREDALRYFAGRGIRWHDGIDGAPSNHLCCSQSCCVNFWFPFVRAPQELAAVLRKIGYDVAEVLPFTDDEPLDDGAPPYVAFEWIGARNYLDEHRRGRVAADHERTRGAGFTSLDFAIRFRRGDGRIQILAGEWKYTEAYASKSKRHSGKTDRLEQIYRPHLEHPDCQIVTGTVELDALFFDPFDQLMRQQLLCSAMEREHEMGADVVSLLHIAPQANGELMSRVTSPRLQELGNDVHGIWSRLTSPDRFRGIHVEDLLPEVCGDAPTRDTAEYLQRRFGGMA
ncbi:MAG: hypothetical protein F4X98_12740 [Gammaproteobacteria bacterium]|nr:hypothetical protein [Gammaproteobacteria bacterium]